MRVPEREHEPPDFVAYVEIPAALKSVQRFQCDADADENKKRPPTKTNMFISRIVHIKSAVILSEAKNVASHPARNFAVIPSKAKDLTSSGKTIVRSFACAQHDNY